MAFLFADSFDFYASAADAGTRWAQFIPNNNAELSADTPFGTGQCLRLNTAQYFLAAAVWPSSEGTAYFTFRTRLTSVSNLNGLQLSLTDNGAQQVSIFWNSDGSVSARTGNRDGTMIGTFPGAFSFDAWDSWQLKVTISDTSGSVELRKNGSPTPLVSYAGKNTRGGSGNSTANGFFFTGTGYGGNQVWFLLDDVFCNSASGAAPASWPGDLRAIQQATTGATQSQLAATGAASNWQALAEAHQDGDASYVSGNTAGQEDIYTLSAIPANFAVVGVNYLVSWKKTDAGPRTAQLSVAANGSPDTPVATNPALANTYAYSSAYLALDPTGAPWTPATAGGARIGLAVTV